MIGFQNTLGLFPIERKMDIGIFMKMLLNVLIVVKLKVNFSINIQEHIKNQKNTVGNLIFPMEINLQPKKEKNGLIVLSIKRLKNTIQEAASKKETVVHIKLLMLMVGLMNGLKEIKNQTDIGMIKKDAEKQQTNALQLENFVLNMVLHINIQTRMDGLTSFSRKRHKNHKSTKKKSGCYGRSFRLFT